ncbi:MAG: hypothetical protein AB1401_05795 [Thermodesulfobacteriota bacterium]
MLYEYALDPCVLYNFDKVRYFLEKFGVHRGRLISRFPKKWKKMVYDACAACSDYERKRIEESLINADLKLMKTSRSYDYFLAWIINAEEQHNIKPFHAIISNANPRGIPEVLIADAVSEENTPLLRVKREDCVPRSAEVLAKLVQPLLQMSSEVLFVDPHFDPTKKRFRRTLFHFLMALDGNEKVNRIEYHVGDDLGETYFKTECMRHIPLLLPRNRAITFVRWKQHEDNPGDQLHPRYVLTDLGGIRIDVGLDEGEEGETTDISLLDLPLYQQRWKDYGESPAFEFVDKITIVGS